MILANNLLIYNRLRLSQSVVWCYISSLTGPALSIMKLRCEVFGLVGNFIYGIIETMSSAIYYTGSHAIIKHDVRRTAVKNKMKLAFRNVIGVLFENKK